LYVPTLHGVVLNFFPRGAPAIDVSRLRALQQEVIDPVIAANGGRLIKTTGDGSLIEFGSVVDAVRCARCRARLLCEI
jgi:class 3 adenylate cyclase